MLGLVLLVGHVARSHAVLQHRIAVRHGRAGHGRIRLHGIAGLIGGIGCAKRQSAGNKQAGGGKGLHGVSP